ncbi:MAG: alpha/beta hydrolase [Anaerolineales bacterium]|jgi:phospholipase/carboxylesterase
MTDEARADRHSLNGWVYRLRQPVDSAVPAPVYLLLHGWTGDENVMWVFADRIPAKFLEIAPRAPYPAPRGGYSWQPEMHTGWPDYEALHPTAEQLLKFIDELRAVPELHNADFERINLMGFSQGAALSYTFALTYPQRVRSLVGLAGFLPNNVSQLVSAQPLAGTPVFIAHGTLDTLVPVPRARQSVELLERAGARVTYCEDQVEHKLGTTCFQAMQAFIERNL